MSMSTQKKSLVLIVDDNPNNIKVLGKIIEEMHCDVAMVMNGKDALIFLEEDKPDLILLDVMMPEIDGYEVCKLIKKDEKHKNIPIIFITAKTDTEDVVKGFKVGAIDYITKPFNIEELCARVSTQLELKKTRDKLEETIKNLEIASMTDALTGIYNRRFVMEKLKIFHKSMERSKKVFSIAICDLDFFKQINDSYGHDCGDWILKSVCELINRNIRCQDILGRWGGEEFILIFPDTEIEKTKIACENIRQKLYDSIFNFDGNEIQITITIGVSQIVNGRTIEELIKDADNALYKGKSKGKNCVFAN